VTISTSGGANIVIDVLTQAAYLERRSTLSNNGVTPSGPYALNYVKGKFFPRGCRGFINTVDLYLKGAAEDVTITVSFRPYPGGAEVFNVTYVLVASAAEEWKTISVNKMWNYDGMFIKVSSTDHTSLVAFEDAGTPLDSYQADYATPDTFSFPAIRYWFRVTMTGQSVGDLPVSGFVNVKDIDTSINVPVAVQGTVTVTGAVTVSGTVAVSGTVTVSGTVAVSGTVTVSGSVTVSGTVAVSGTVTVTGSVTVSGSVSITGSVTVEGAVTVTGSVTVSGTVAVSGTVTVTGTVAISGSVTVSGTVAVSGTVTVSGAVTVSGSVSITGSVTVEGAVTVSGTVAISGSVAVTGAVTVSGSVSITGSVTITGAVTITSGAVTISTSGGANIVIDMLTQAAYLERRSTLSNNGVTPSGPNPFDYRKGKFFPRGCRGFIQSVELYLKGAAGAVTVTVSFRVHPEGGEVFNVSYVLGASAAEEWKTIAVNSMWNYDSMFVVCYSADTTSSVGFEDSGTPYDAYFASPGTEEYSTVANVRFWYRVVMIGQTIGDLPVSGTINTIEVPSLASARQAQQLSVPVTSALYDTLQPGAGEMIICIFSVSSDNDLNNLNPRIRIDGSQVLPVDTSIASWKMYYLSATTPGIAIGVYDASGHNYSLVVAISLPFRRSLEVGFYNIDPSNVRTGYVNYVYKKIV
jgi:cytoskeletal protein CcmA (bactofilin family)